MIQHRYVFYEKRVSDDYSGSRLVSFVVFLDKITFTLNHLFTARRSSDVRHTPKLPTTTSISLFTAVTLSESSLSGWSKWTTNGKACVVKPLASCRCDVKRYFQKKPNYEDVVFNATVPTDHFPSAACYSCTEWPSTFTGFIIGFWKFSTTADEFKWSAGEMLTGRLVLSSLHRRLSDVWWLDRERRLAALHTETVLTLASSLLKASASMCFLRNFPWLVFSRFSNKEADIRKGKLL